MSPKKDFNKKSNEMDEKEIVARMYATERQMRTMGPEALALYNTISNTGVYDPKKFTQTYTIPAGADPKALKAALVMIDVSQDPAMKIMLVEGIVTREMPRDPDVVAHINANAAKGAKPKKPTV